MQCHLVTWQSAQNLECELKDIVQLHKISVLPLALQRGLEFPKGWGGVLEKKNCSCGRYFMNISWNHTVHILT